jgi:Tfp pilus assembly protein PilN
MLRTNLATRPFYNQRAVRLFLAVVGAVAIGLTLFNAYEILYLRGQNRDAAETIARNDTQARDHRVKAAEIRRSIDRTRLDAVSFAAREANALIDRRTFSWTELLNQFQLTLPPDVRIGGVQLQLDNDGRRLVQISVFSRRIEDLEEFMDALGKTGMFSGVLSRMDTPEESGTLRSELQAYYIPAPLPAATAPPSSSEPGKTPRQPGPANQSAGSTAGSGGAR